MREIARTHDGIGDAQAPCMARTPHSYDEITRRTVLDPDTSLRPPLPQTCDRPDAAIYHDIAELLEDLKQRHIGFEVHNGHVVLRGYVRDHQTAEMIEQAVRGVDCVEDIESHLTTLH